MPCIKIILNFQNELRLHHWGTKSYSTHKILGKAYTGIDNLLDTFAETYMGALGKEELKQINTLELNGPFRTSAVQVLDSFEEYLTKEITKELDPSQTALLNIRDEMLALVQQTKYLLTLS